MRRALILGGCLLAAFLAACGGSSSETPWPAEPVNAALGPAGEVGPGNAADLVRDGGAAASAPPSAREPAPAGGPVVAPSSAPVPVPGGTRPATPY